MKQLMKIDAADYGFGGYDDAMFGISWRFSGDGCGVGDFWGTWPLRMTRSQHAQWDEEDRDNIVLDTQLRLEQVLRDAKVRHLHELIGKPVEITFEGDGGWGGKLQSWRILTEVL